MPTTRDAAPESDFQRNLGKIYAIYACGFLAAGVVLAMIEQLGAPAPVIGLIFTGLTLATYLLLGGLSRTSDRGDYFLARRSVPAAYNGMATAAQWTTVAGAAGLTGTLYSLGFDGLAYPVGLIGGFVLMGVLIVPYLRKLGATTVPDFFAVRYGAIPGLLAAAIVIASTFAILAAQLTGIGLVASRYLGLPFDGAVWTGLGVLLVSTVPGGMKSATRTQAAQYVVLLIAVLVPALLIAMKSSGWPLPQLTYGAALQQVAALETGMIEKGLASASTLKPHVAPFLQLDMLNFAGLIFCLMAGTASLPHLLMRYMTVPTVREARLSVAWSAFFALLLAITIPAYAAFAKLQVYGLIDKGTTFAALPPWIENYSRRDLVRVHGVSLRMLDDTSAAVQSGAADSGAVATYLQAHALVTSRGFAELKETAKTALLDAAKATGGLSDGPRWEAFRQSVLPVAAKAAGNKTGMLTESGLWIEPSSLLFVLPEMAGMPAAVTGLVAAGAIAAALATASGVLIAIANALGHDFLFKLLDRGAPDRRRLAVSRILLVAAGAGAAAAALMCPAEFSTLVTWAFSLAASGLFPALVLGIWWKRANGWGAAAGMIAGFGLGLYYMIGTHFFPVAFHDLWGPFSSASDTAVRKLAGLQSVWSAAGADAKPAAWAALEAQARGTAAHAGVANWFGVLTASAALFAVPLGFAVIALVSLLTPKPWPETIALVDEMRRPKGPEILDDA